MAWLDLPETPPGQGGGLDPRDIEETLHHAGGAGGQHQNKTLSAVRLKHRPTGILVDARCERSQHQNRSMALVWLAAKVNSLQDARDRSALSDARRSLHGSGQRGDKIATWRWQDDRVTDHRTGTRCSLRDALDGKPPWAVW